MLNAQLAELEQSFRRTWKRFAPQSYEAYLEQVDDDERPALLARLISVDLEYAYQPPQLLGEEEETNDFETDENDERTRPRLQLLLLRFPELSKHRDLIVQLAILEFALRLRFDPESPSLDSYLDMCPNDRERLSDMLQVMESKLGKQAAGHSSSQVISRNDTTVTEGRGERPLTLSQLPCSLGYFLLIDVIGQGGMGTVYSAIDLRSAAHVAVKIVRRFDSWSVYRFIEEFTWLANLNHPNVVKLYDTFSEGDLRYFSMELVEGQNIRDWFGSIRSKPDAWQRLRGTLSQAAIAISFLHERGVVHRDVKSSNLMVTARDKAVILDLGLASRAGQDVNTARRIDGEHLIGTLPYLSPEALRGGPPSFSSDWYSFGVMIFEVMTDDFPPSHIDPKTLQLRDHSESDFEARVRSKLADCPEGLRELCVALLRFEPDSRPFASSILLQLGYDLGQPIAFRVEDSDFIGRSEALHYLGEQLESAVAHRGAISLVRGESGIGKTTLLQHWRKMHCRDGEVLWLTIRCRNQDHTPLRALNLLVQEMVTELSMQPTEVWIDLARGGGEEVVHTFPQMERLREAEWPILAAPSDPVEASARRAVGLHALLGWLKGLSHRRRLVIAIDDAQWADAESGRVLAHLVREENDFRGLLLLLDQGRQVESQFLNAMLESQPTLAEHLSSYELKPLKREDCLTLIERWTQRLRLTISETAVHDFVKRSAGSPFLLQELFRAYTNYVVRHKLSDQEWFTDSDGREGLLHRRFSMIPAEAEMILQFLALSDEALGIHQLQTVTRVMPAQLLAELNLLSGQGWIRWNGRTLDSEVEISHERFRDIVLQSMMDDRRQRRHKRLARMLLAEVPPPWPRIAHHYSEAKHLREAAACYLEGARVAAKHLSFPEALWLLNLAFHPQAQRTPQEMRDARRLEADCLAGNGSSESAAFKYQALALSANCPEESLTLQCLAGEQWIRAGRLQQGIECLRVPLERLQISPDTPVGFDQVLLKLQVAWQAWKAPPKSLPTDDAKPFSPIEQTLNRLCGPMGFLDTPLGLRLILFTMKNARRRGSSQDRAMAMMRWAIILSYSKRRERQNALHWMRAAKRLTRNTPSANIRAMAHVTMFIWLTLQGRWRDSLRYGRRAERLYQTQHASDTWETGFVCWISLAHMWNFGELRELTEKTALYREDAIRRSDTMWIYWMHCNGAHLADLVRDDVEGGRRALEKASEIVGDGRFGTPQFILWVSRLRHLLYEGRAQEALKLFRSELPKVEAKNMARISYYAWVIDCLRINCCIGAAQTDIEGRGRYLDEARTAVRRLRHMEEPPFTVYGSVYPLLLDALEGKRARAAQWEELITEAEHRHMGLLKMALQWHYALQHSADQDEVEAARRRFVELGVVKPEQLMNLILPLPKHAEV
ncbi:MAG: protein kinase [Pirellulales bacterium]